VNHSERWSTTWAAGTCAYRRSRRPNRPLGFAVEDIDSIVDEFEKRALKAERFPNFQHDERGVGQAPDGTRVVWFRDPDGNLLSVVQYA
jgi:catechol 2,3-dioxygenase-like lactoylglutathione lyase family enzyme